VFLPLFQTLGITGSTTERKERMAPMQSSIQRKGAIPPSAHLVRGAFYLLLLVVLSAIPFALAQRKIAKQSLAKPGVAQNGAMQGVTQRAMTAGPLAPPRVIAPRQRMGPSIGTSCTDYTFTLGTDTFVPGVDDTGNHCDDCLTSISLPFPVNLYDQTFTGGFVGSNGALFFLSGNASFAVTCSPFGLLFTSYVLAPYWTDQCTGNCFNDTCPGCGIFTTTTGTAPNRVFYVEYRADYSQHTGTFTQLDYEVALNENGAPPFEYIYSSITPAMNANDSQLVVGVKKNDTTFTQYGCDPTGGQNPPVSSGQAVIASCVGGVTPTASPTPTPTLTPTPTPTGTPTGCQFKVLIVNADCGILATMLTNELLADGATLVDNFDAVNGTPTLAQLQQYDIVVPISNCVYSDRVTLGNNLDAYESGGGVVVAFTFDWNGGSFSIGGAWITDDSPFNDNAPTNFTNGTLGTCTVTELCNGVTTLNAFYRESPTLASGATQAATWNDGGILMAYKGNAVAVSAYVGDSADNWSGDFARIILNAASFLRPNCQASPTPTATATATATVTATPTATITPSPSPTATATSTPTAAPRSTPTPRPRPTPAPRP